MNPLTLVGDLGRRCVAARPSPQHPVSVDLAEFMMEIMEIPKPYHYGVRLMSIVDHKLLTDDKTIGSQRLPAFRVGPQDEEKYDVFFVKMVFMKANLNHNEKKLANSLFIRGIGEFVHFGAVSHQQWIVKGLGVSWDNSRVLGVLYQHKASQDHCEMAKRGVDPRIESKPLPLHTKRSRSL